MNEIAFYLKPSADSEDVWQQLEELGCQLLYSSEENDGSQVIFGRLPKKISSEAILSECPMIHSIEEAPFDPIDWESQWANHGADYHDGFVHVNLHKFTEIAHPSIIKLKPGPGFGDLSHPTTRLALTLMAGVVRDKVVVDVGCGSGILALAAIAMGAKSVIGIDIDVEALQHANENATINGMEQNIRFALPEEISASNVEGWDKEAVIVMNMIHSEQQVAWSSLKVIHPYASVIVTSGILNDELNTYLKLCRQWHWQEVDHIENEGWLGFHFKK